MKKKVNLTTEDLQRFNSWVRQEREIYALLKEMQKDKDPDLDMYRRLLDEAKELSNKQEQFKKGDLGEESYRPDRQI